jgi:Enoyl-(Acyl carrier protein) reductase
MLGRIGEPEDIPNAVVFLASPESGWITAQVLTVDGGRLEINAECGERQQPPLMHCGRSVSPAVMRHGRDDIEILRDTVADLD